MTIADTKKTAEIKMGKSIEAFKSDIQKIRTGRAHPGRVEVWRMGTLRFAHPTILDVQDQRP